MKLRKYNILMLCVLLIVIGSYVGCSKKGPAEKAGTKIDQTFNAAKDKFNEATK